MLLRLPPKSTAGKRIVDTPTPLRQVFLDLPQRNTLAFSGRQGGHLIHKRWAKAIWRPTSRRLGYVLRFHDLRHFGGSLRIRFGGNVLLVSHQMGHSAPSVTLNVYGHLMREGRSLDREATIARLMEAFRAPGPARAARVRPEGGRAREGRGLKPAPDLVETSGFEPPTPSLRTRCSPS